MRFISWGLSQNKVYYYGNNEHDKENAEYNFSNLLRGRGNVGKTKDCRYDRNNQKHQNPL